MSKELPYFRFTPQEWQNGDIGVEPFDVKGLFIDICSFYWVRDCSITTAMLEKRYSHATELLNQLYEVGILGVSGDDNFVVISFLNDQFDILSEKRTRRQEAGRAGGLRKSSNAKAKLQQCSSKTVAIKIKRKNDNDKDKENAIPLALLDIDNFNETWLAFLDSRVAMRKKATKHAQGLLLKKLATRPHDSIALLNMAIEKGWSGLDWKWFDNSSKSFNKTGTSSNKNDSGIMRSSYPKNKEHWK